MDDFVESSSKEYHLDLVTSNKPMKSALADYLKEMFAVRAVFVGTRRTDPHGAHLQPFQETDGDWPRFMRIHPVIDWHYRDVWTVSNCLTPALNTVAPHGSPRNHQGSWLGI
jgi:FAD synthetase